MEKQLSETEAANALLQGRLKVAEDKNDKARDEITLLRTKAKLLDDEICLRQEKECALLDKLKSFKFKVANLQKTNDRLIE